MKTRILRGSAADNLQFAAEAVRRGALVAFPTDTVYGLGAGAFDAPAVERIYVVKDRPPDRVIPVLLASADDIGLVAVNVSAMAHRLAERFWPGPVTLVVPKKDDVPDAVADRTVGIRVPDHELARALLAIAGPMAVTSANLSGDNTTRTAAEVLSQLSGSVELILDGGTTPGGIPSTVVDCTGSEPAIIRAGPVSLRDLRLALE